MNNQNPHGTNFGVAPYLTLIKTEMLDRIQGIPPEQKPKLQVAVHQAWHMLRVQHPSTPEHAAALLKLQQVGVHIRRVVEDFKQRQSANAGGVPGSSAGQLTAQASQQARMQAQQQSQQNQGQGQTPQQQAQPNAQSQLQAQQARLAQAQAQAQAQGQSQAQQPQISQANTQQQQAQGMNQSGQNAAQSSQQAAGQRPGGANAMPVPQQPAPQASAQIRAHVDTFVFTYPPTHAEGTPDGAKWIEATKAQYTSLLAYLDQANQVRIKKNEQMVKAKAANQLTPQIEREVQASLLQYQRYKTQLETFRQNQAKLRARVDEQRNAQGAETKKEGASATTNTNNAPVTSANANNMANIPQKPFTLQQPPQGNGSAAAASAAAASGTQSSGMANNPAINTAKTSNAQNAGNAASPIQAQTPTSQSMLQNPQGQYPRQPGVAQNHIRPPLNTHPGQQGQPGQQGIAMAQGQTGPSGNQQQPEQAYSHSDALSAARSHSEHRPTTSSAPNALSQSSSHSSNMSQSQHKFPISKTLPQSVLNQPAPVMISQPRPTMAAGGASSQPIIAKQPAFTIEGDGSAHVLSKKKLHELVRQVTGGGETLTPEMEEVLMEVADEFVDSLVTTSCRLAKLRPDATLEIKDIQTVLERNYNIRIPGYSQDETRVTRRVNPSPAWSQKIGAINTAKVMGSTKTDP